MVIAKQICPSELEQVYLRKRKGIGIGKEQTWTSSYYRYLFLKYVSIRKKKGGENWQVSTNWMVKKLVRKLVISTFNDLVLY